MKCDVIIPVYNSPEWIKPCVESVLRNTPVEYLNNIILIDDGSDNFTFSLLENLAKNNVKVVLLRNDKNLGFIRTVNKGLSYATAPYILLLNSDCLITKNTIPKLVSHAMTDKTIGLVSPVSNNSSPATLDMLRGYSFIDMNELAEKLFFGKCFDACTIVGNCLLITRECLDSTGLLDT